LHHLACSRLPGCPSQRNRATRHLLTPLIRPKVHVVIPPRLPNSGQLKRSERGVTTHCLSWQCGRDSRHPLHLRRRGQRVGSEIIGTPADEMDARHETTDQMGQSDYDQLPHRFRSSDADASSAPPRLATDDSPDSPYSEPQDAPRRTCHRRWAISGPLTPVNGGQSRSWPGNESPSPAVLTASCNTPSKLVMGFSY